MTSQSDVTVLSIDSGDAATFNVAVSPFAPDTAMTAQITDPAGGVATITMTANTDKSLWTGSSAVLTLAGEYTAKFTVTGTGLGVTYYTVIVETPPPQSASVRRVRLLIADTDPAKRLFRVDEVQDFLDMEGGTVKLAAATALETIARSEVLVSKVIRTQDLSTDGAKVAAELRASAKELRLQVEMSEGDSDTGFDVIDYVDPNTIVVSEFN